MNPRPGSGICIPDGQPLSPAGAPSQGWQALTKDAGWAPSQAWKTAGCPWGPGHALGLPPPPDLFRAVNIYIYIYFSIDSKGCQEVRQ